MQTISSICYIPHSLSPPPPTPTHPHPPPPPPYSIIAIMSLVLRRSAIRILINGLHTCTSCVHLTMYIHMHVHVKCSSCISCLGSSVVERSVYSVECRGFKSHPRQLIFLRKSDCLGCAVLLCLIVCLTLLASFFLPSLISN